MLVDKVPCKGMNMTRLVPKDVPCEVEVVGYPRSGTGDMHMDKGEITKIDKTPLEGYDFIFHDLIT